ncbi:unnamed protein product [Aspergillus oryzae var. brunneus]|uniref:Unnamed protein product n=2 Tax=Aspergillus oryzae TaxID=5062 RepID=A0AAN4YVT3_ASPOZ|nr:unnamed protein product [Aspergillus oryzae]GMG37814.1 unnamed protein product [Aspergillus oryzae]GMG53572.1 unnamed protein product [Aspergillus oryzae var. brunneus]
MSKGKLTGADVAEHNSRDSCWVIIHGKAYDITEFLPGIVYRGPFRLSLLTVATEHPGGQKIILKYAGKDATEEFDPIHPPDTLEKYLDPSKHLGEVDMSTVEQEEKVADPEETERQERIKRMPPLQACYNLMDFEAVARDVMKKTAWAYYSSGADDEIVGGDSMNQSTYHANNMSRLCVKTTLPSTRSGSVLKSSLMWRMLTSPQQCSERRHRFPST